MHAAPNHDVLKLPRLNEMPNLTLGDADAGRELLRGFESVSHPEPAGFLIFRLGAGLPLIAIVAMARSAAACATAPHELKAAAEPLVTKSLAHRHR
jgi:hypothetical protein